MDGKTYEELLQDVAWEMGKRFKEKGEAVLYLFVSPPEGTDPVIFVHDETKVMLGEIDQFYLSLIKQAMQENRHAKQLLDQAVKIMREMRRANDGK